MKGKWAIPVLASILILGTLGLPQSVFSHGNIDQSFTGPCTGGGLNVNAFVPAGQEFTPTVSNLASVDLFLSDPPVTTSVTVKIHLGSVTGPIVGTITQNVPFPVSTPVHFDFPSPIPLTPGSIYVIEATSPGPFGLSWCVGVGNPYTGGSAIKSGNPQSFDFAFTTFFLAAQTPEEQAESLIEDVKDLTLDDVDSTKLTKSLDKILKALDNEDAVTACDQLNKFIKDTQKLIDKGKLVLAVGQPLINSANDLKDAIPC